VIAFDAIKTIQQAGLQIVTSDLHSQSAESRNQDINFENLLFCPMIDARRMEVFVAVYDSRLNEVVKPQACVLSPGSFANLMKRQKILFLGNGSKKFQQTCQNPENAMFKNLPLNSSALATLTYRNFIGNNFATLAYTEPLYLKEFFTQ